MQRVLDNMEAEIPEVLVEQQLDKIIDDYGRRITSRSSRSTVPQDVNMISGDLRKNLRESALGQCARSRPFRRRVAERMEIPRRKSTRNREVAEMYQIPEQKVREVVAPKRSRGT